MASPEFIHEIQNERITRIEDVLREHAAQLAANTTAVAALDTRVDIGFTDLKQGMLDGFSKMDDAIAALTTAMSDQRVQVGGLQKIEDERSVRRKKVMKWIGSTVSALILLLAGAIVKAKLGAE